MKVNENVIYRCIANEHILIPVGDTALSNNGLFVLNEVSAEIWQLLSAEKTLDEIVVAIAERFDAPADVIRADTEALIHRLAEAGLLTL